MERDAGTQVTSPAFFFHHELFHDSTLFGKKWEPPWQNPSFRRTTPQISSPVIPTPSHPDQWDWDSRDFAAKPAKLYGENLSLMLGGGDFASVEEQVSVAMVRPLSFESSNPMEDRFLPSSPLVPQKLFPVHPVIERRCKGMSICREDNQAAEANTNCRWSTRMEIFKDSERQAGNNIVLNNRSQADYASSLGSYHSPSSSTYDT